MAKIKSFLDGLGTAAGTAWPLFGILSSTLTLMAGGPAVIALGAICCFIFLGVFVTITYFSYQQSKKEKKALNDKIAQEISKCKDLLKNHMTICNESDSDMKMVMALINYLRLDSRNFSRPDKFFDTAMGTSYLQKPSLAQQFKLAFSGFVGGFSPVAGCCAGVCGLLAGVGLLSGLGAFPIAGFLIFSCAVATGIIVAFKVMETNEKRLKKEQVYENFRTVNKTLKKIHKQRGLIEHNQYLALDETHDNACYTSVFTQYSEPKEKNRKNAEYNKAGEEKENNKYEQQQTNSY